MEQKEAKFRGQQNQAANQEEIERLTKQSAYFENQVRQLESKLAQAKAPYEVQIRELQAKIIGLEGDLNDLKPVTLS